MEDQFDPSKEGRRVVICFGQPNENQVTEGDQREQEREARANNGAAEENKK
jgi:hypothetical protein